MLEATLAILNGQIITLDPKQPKAEAVAIQNEKIVVVGSNKQIRKHVGKKTRTIDAKGKMVIPGLVDCHVHLAGYGKILQTLDLRNTESIKEMQQKLREYAEKNPEKSWIRGGRWDQETFAEKRYPTRLDLDVAVADRPVFLFRVCGHIAVANSKALQLAGITKETKIDGGKIDLDEVTGEPNGILRENAMNLVSRAIPKHSQKEIREACLLACKKAVELGLTCVHWILGSTDEMRILQELYVSGKLPLRIYVGIPVDCLDELISLGLLTGFGDNMIKIGFVKILADGSLGGRTAALKRPYFDNPETSGMMLYTQTKLNKLVLKAHEAGLQLAVHAIGDRTMEVVLKSFEKALKLHPRRNHRHRIEHCSVANPKLIKRIKRSSIVASVQPHFIVSDFWMLDRLGRKRARWVYALKTLFKEGIVVASGSDCPVEPLNPVLGIWAAVARKNFTTESLTAQEALKAYTVNAAYASFDDDQRGTIEAGKLADITILSADLFEIQPDDIRNVKVVMTIVDGKIVYAS